MFIQNFYRWFLFLESFFVMWEKIEDYWKISLQVILCLFVCFVLLSITARKWKYSEMFEFRIRDHDSLESWGIQGAHLTWSILKYSARIHPNILCWVSFVDFPKRTLQQISSASYWWYLKTVFNITWCGWFQESWNGPLFISGENSSS